MRSWNDKYILKQWENPASFPPIPPSDVGYARAKLTVFRSATEWLTIIEIVGFDSEAGLCLNTAYPSGSADPGKLMPADTIILAPPSSVHGAWFRTDSNGALLLDPLDFEVFVYGKLRRFIFSPADYEAYGIDTNQIVAAEIDPIVKVLRLLTYKYPHWFFLTEADLLEKFNSGVLLPGFLELYSWHHPDWQRNETPANSPCIQRLAAAIAANDPAIYECPDKLHNTHWSNWPEWPN